MKHTIGLFTNWYPTKENPYAGLFFKEQAFALEETFDFHVFHLRQHVKKPFSRDFTVSPSREERNTKEFEISVQIPLAVILGDILETTTQFLFGKNRFDCKYVCTKHRRDYLRKTVQKACRNDFASELDVLYCISAQTEADFVRMIAEGAHKPYVVSEHAPFPWPGSRIDPYAIESIERADAFLAISNDKIKQVKQQNICIPPTYYVGNMVDDSLFSFVEQQPEEHIKTFVIVAANSFFKNYDMFIEIMDRLTEITSIPFRVMIVGYAANKGYSQNKEEFERKIQNSSFSDRAELIPEAPHERIVEYLHKADAFVMTSIQEGQPVSAMEAACCGLPVFSTRCGGVEDYITEETGRLFPITDVEGFAEALKQFIEGDISFDSRIIRKRISDRYGRDAFVRNMTNAFCSIITKNALH